MHLIQFSSQDTKFNLGRQNTLCQDKLDHSIYMSSFWNNHFDPLVDLSLNYNQYTQLMSLNEFFLSAWNNLTVSFCWLWRMNSGRTLLVTLLSQLQSVRLIVRPTSLSESKCVNSKVCLFIMKRVMACSCIVYAFKPCKFHEVVRMRRI